MESSHNASPSVSMHGHDRSNELYVPSSIIDSLPEELQVQIAHHVAGTAPSVRHADHQPSVDTVRSSAQPLKTLSLVSSKWHRLCLPLLFRYMRLNVAELLPDDFARIAEQRFSFVHKRYLETAAFYRFMRRNRLNDMVRSLLVYAEADDPCVKLSYCSDQDGKAPFTAALFACMWQQLMVFFSPDRLVVCAPANSLCLLFGIRMGSNDPCWTDAQACQTIELVTDARVPADKMPVSGNASTSLLAMRPWKGLKYHEASSCHDTSIHDDRRGPPNIFVGSPSFMNVHGSLLTSVTRFSYFADYPHVRRFRDVLQQLQKLPCMAWLTLQLAPLHANGEYMTPPEPTLESLLLRIRRCYDILLDCLVQSATTWTKFTTRDCVVWHSIGHEHLARRFDEWAPNWRRITDDEWVKDTAV